MIHAAVMPAPNQPVEIREFPEPDIAPGGMLLATEYSEVCGTDVHGYLSDQPYNPAICGHEWVGTVSAVGAASVILQQRAAEIRIGGQVAGVIVLGLAAAAAIYFIRRTRYLVGSVASEEIKRARLGRYFSPNVAAKLAEQADGKGPSTREVTLLFSDIRGFTSMSEKSKATGKDSCAPWLSVREVQVDAEDD